MILRKHLINSFLSVISYCQLLKLVKVNKKMLAECIVAFGTMLVPLAVVLLTTVDNFPQNTAMFLIIVGTISLFIGLFMAIRNEIRESKNAKRLERREKLRIRVYKSNLVSMLHIAEKLGVDMSDILTDVYKNFDEDDIDEL